MPDDADYGEDAESMFHVNTPAKRDIGSPQSGQPQRTLSFTGLSHRTTYIDLMSVLKGGKIISAILRSSSALVTFATGAAEFLAWSKRNDIYLQGKRVSSNVS